MRNYEKVSLVEIRRVVEMSYVGQKGIKLRYHQPELFVSLDEAARYVDMEINHFISRVEKIVDENEKPFNMKGFVVNKKSVKFELIIYLDEQYSHNRRLLA